ncbi:MAG: hypothetical protein AAFQ64_03020 [Pseudomonadota bacterium]
MSKAIFRRIAAGTAACAVLAAGVAIPFGAFAQQNEQGGMLFQFRFAERLQFRDSDSPDPEENGQTTQLTTDLGLSFSSETRTEALSADFDAGYRLIDGPTTDGVTGEFMSPRLNLSYSQAAATASFDVSATASRAELSEISPLEASTNEEDALPPDFAELTDAGTRDQIGFDARLSLRDDAPFGIILGAGVNDISFTNLPAGSGLRDRTNGRLYAVGRFDVSKVMQVRSRLQYDIADKDGEELVERFGLSSRATLLRPDGNYRVSGSVSGGDGGEQAGLSFGRLIERPKMSVDVDFGLSQSATDGFYVTGNAEYSYAFGQQSVLGTVTASAERFLRFANGADEDLVTSLSVGSNYALSPLATIAITAQVAQAETLLTGERVDLAQARISVGYDLSRDWRASAGLRTEWRDPSNDVSSESTSLSLSFSRSFDLRR